MKVVEIFDSMQGEGDWMGVMCTFVRFAGCNLSCSFCDEAKKYSKAKEMSIEKIVEKCKQNIVVLTGGEPTIQPQLRELVAALHSAGHSVHIETNGTNYVPCEVDWVTVSPKAPKYECKYPHNEIKLVVSKDLTLKQALTHTGGYLLCGQHVWLQPCDGPWLEQSKKTILKWIKKYPDLFRAGIQLHKYYGAR